MLLLEQLLVDRFRVARLEEVRRAMLASGTIDPVDSTVSNFIRCPWRCAESRSLRHAR